MSNKPVIIVGESASKSSAAPTSADMRNVKGRLGNIENLTQAVLWVGIGTIVAVLITCCALVLDQMHFNNQTYKDQSEKVDLQNEKMILEIQSLQSQINSLEEKDKPSNKETQPAG